MSEKAPGQRASLAARLLGFLLGLLARLWLATLRVRVIASPALVACAGRPWVLSFFHGTQLALLRWPRRGTTVALVSLSRDGSLQAGALSAHGLDVVRGSSSRGGARGLAAIVHRLRKGADAAFAVDGPRGPYGVVKPGAVAAAKSARGVLVPMGSAASRAHVLERAWDRLVVPLPFARVVVVVGDPIEPTESDAAATLERAIAATNAHAAALLEDRAGARPSTDLAR